jgi:hypothetical protein
MTYLHIGLYQEVWQLFEYAPVAADLSGESGVTTREEPPDDDADDGPSSEQSGTNIKDCNASSSEQTDTETAQHAQSRTTDDNKKHTAAQRSFPTCWFEDEESGQPLRWHLFVGVLFDLMKGRAKIKHSSRKGFTNEVVPANMLPWRIKVHFTAYPTTLLPLDDGVAWTASSATNTKRDIDDNNNNSGGIVKSSNTESIHKSRISALIGRNFRNSLKQALFMQYSSSKVAMSVNKSSHEKMWDAILTTNFTSYHEVNVELQVGITTSSVSAPTTEQSTKSRDASGGIPRLVPVRVLVNDKRAMQKPCRALANAGSAGKTEAINVHVEDQRTEQQSEGDDAAIDSLIKRLTATSVTPHTTLGDVLASLLPQHFVKDETGTVTDESTYFCIQGIQPSMDCAIVDLWKSLCNPDHFLYIVVVTQ